MTTRILSWNGSLCAASRLRSAQSLAISPVSLAETAILLGCGAAAAAAVLLIEFKLRMPGHAILRAVLPMALGLALVPRRGAGTVMGVGAIGTAMACTYGGIGKDGLGSITSLCMIGPALDLAVLWLGNGRWIYLSLIVTGLVTNLSAMAVQGTLKYLTMTGGGGGGGGGGQRFVTWLPMALWTYPLFGIVAGLVSAIVWFRWNSDSRPATTDPRT